MTEFSMPWETINGVGDGGYSYDMNQTQDFFYKFLNPGGDSGVYAGLDQGMEATINFGLPDDLDIEPGKAMILGFMYENTAAVNFVPTPVASATAHRVVLEADWTAQTIRLALYAATTGVTTPPSLTQTIGTLYQIPLYSFIYTSAGRIQNLDAEDFKITDDRVPIRLPGVAATAVYSRYDFGGNSGVARLPTDMNHCIMTLGGRSSGVSDAAAERVGITWAGQPAKYERDHYYTSASSAAMLGSSAFPGPGYTNYAFQPIIGNNNHNHGGVARIYMPNYREPNFYQIGYMVNVYNDRDAGWQVVYATAFYEVAEAIDQVDFSIISGAHAGSMRLSVMCWR